MFMVEQDENATDMSKIRKVHQTLNHKSKEQMHFVYKNAGKLDTMIRKKIPEVIEECKICKTNARSTSIYCG